jgi:hypothetical protein
MDHGKNHQVCVSEQPLYLGAASLSNAREPSEVLVLNQAAQVIEADAGDVRHFVLSEKFLARLDPNRWHTAHVLRCLHVEALQIPLQYAFRYERRPADLLRY